MCPVVDAAGAPPVPVTGRTCPPPCSSQLSSCAHAVAPAAAWALCPLPAASHQLLGGGFQKGGLASSGTDSEVWCSLSSSCKQGLTRPSPSLASFPPLPEGSPPLRRPQRGSGRTVPVSGSACRDFAQMPSDIEMLREGVCP